MEKFTKIFRALSDKTRLRIICLLAQAGSELCVCEVMDALGEPQYTISRHLKQLRAAGLVKERKVGKWVFYYLTDPGEQFHKLVLEAISSGATEVLLRDKKRLQARLSLRKDGKCVVGFRSEVWAQMLTKPLV